MLQIARNNLSLAQAEYNAIAKERMFLIARIKDAKFHLRDAELRLSIAEGLGTASVKERCSVLFWVESVRRWLARLGSDGTATWPTSGIVTTYDKLDDARLQELVDERQTHATERLNRK